MTVSTIIAVSVSLIPIFLSLVATLIFLKYPDRHLAVGLFTISLASLAGLFDLLTDTPIITNDALLNLMSVLFQTAGGMIGILGAFLVFYIDSIKNRIIAARKDITRLIKDMDMDRMYAPDQEFLETITRWTQSGKIGEETSQTIKYSLKNLDAVMAEEAKVKLIATNQFSILLISMLASSIVMLFSESLDLTSAPVKLLAYTALSLGMVSLLSSIYGVFRIIYPDIRI